ncbi:MAG: hypothetical protein HKO72_07425 [Flavobacteriaceae bacterium]|nr:hypothetical protein [Bacteroidia bacterium]NNL61149.1 hypothetical protein [Flavobacteriaceae bacterium]
MKQLLIISAILVSFIASAQNNYEKGMQKAFELWSDNKPTEAANLFERIAGAEQDNWLPSYWAAQINIVKSFGEKDADKLSAQLDKAQELIDFATSISQDNPEIMVMQALLHTAWVAYDGATYGMTLSGKVVEIYSKAIQIAPNNPRVILNKAEWDMGAARFFGQDMAPFCKDVQRSIELFESFKPESEFHPNWGLDRAKEIVADCK